jgi:hypothetical protein
MYISPGALELLDGDPVKIHRESGQRFVTYRAKLSGSPELMSPRSSTMTATEGETAQLLTGNFQGNQLPILHNLRVTATKFSISFV